MSLIDAREHRDYKDGVRREWTTAAPGWRKWIDTNEAEGAGSALTAMLLREAHVRTGDDVLDVGSGYGEPGLTAAAAVGPHGAVTCLDISGDMLAFAEERARARGIANVRFLEGDVEGLPLEPDRYDVVLSRAALMYTIDPVATLGRLRSALRPGGRLAVAVWATPDRVAFASPVAVMAEMLGFEPPSGGPGPFALGEPGVLVDAVTRAGFADVHDGEVVASYELPAPDACTEWLRDVAPPITELVANEPAAVQDEVWRRVTQSWTAFQTEGGSVRLPCTAAWAAAVNPG